MPAAPIEHLATHVFETIPGFEADLQQELQAHQAASFGPFCLSDAPLFWCRNEWLSPFRAEFGSIAEAASILRGIQRNWAPSLFTNFRRGALIAERLPSVSRKRRPFPFLVPDSPMGAWTLLDEHTILASRACTSPFPGGIVEFEENKIDPPSRAYLKLWEALVRLRAWPKTGERCLDAGASPGGWTWALANLGADVIALDRTPLDERVSALPNVSFIRHDAFTLKPQDIGNIDWLCCDVICYPPRLFEWAAEWLELGLCRNFICTIKMQGKPDLETTRKFAAIPGSTVVHLHHNKHELTWIKAG